MRPYKSTSYSLHTEDGTHIGDAQVPVSLHMRDIVAWKGNHLEVLGVIPSIEETEYPIAVVRRVGAIIQAE